MGLLGYLIIRIQNSMAIAEKRRKTRKELKHVEAQAYKKQKEIEDEIRWEEKRKQAELRGIERAKSVPGQRFKAWVQLRREKAKARRVRIAEERNASNTEQKKDMSSLIMPMRNATTSESRNNSGLYDFIKKSK